MGIIVTTNSLRFALSQCMVTRQASREVYPLEPCLKAPPTHTLQILLFDFYGEVYVWVGKRSPGSQRKKAIEMGRKVFDAGCRPPVFNLRSSPARASGRYRPRSSIRSSRNSVVNASGKRSSKAKSELAKRPGWAMFAR